MTERFGRALEILPGSPETWRDRFFLTFDIDWGCDEVLADIVNCVSRSASGSQSLRGSELAPGNLSGNAWTNRRNFDDMIKYGNQKSGKLRGREVEFGGMIVRPGSVCRSVRQRFQ